MNREIKFRPEGWTESIVIEEGIYRCGLEDTGLGIYVTKNGEWAPGGVLTREDMLKLIEIFEDHLKKFPLTPPNVSK